MTAPIVWHDDRTPLTEHQIEVIGPEHGSTKLLAERCDRLEIPVPRVPGTLWARLAESDIAAHGEPDLTKVDRRECLTCDRRPDLMREHIASMIGMRRPGVRARRAARDTAPLARVRTAPNGIREFIIEPPVVDPPHRCEVCEEHGIAECPAPPPA